jgi:uncharacterized protein (TIGR03083 family)
MQTLEYLDTVWRAWAALGSSLDDTQWQTGTRLPGWAVADVYAHHSAFPDALAAAVDAPAAGRPPTHSSAAALLAMFNSPGGPARTMSDLVRDHAIRRARQYPPDELVRRFRQAPAVLARAAEIDPARPIDYGGVAVMAFAEATRIGLLEAVVHYLDVARALDLPVPGPVQGGPLHASAALLAEVADPLAFVERATGRSDIDVFPVIR